MLFTCLILEAIANIVLERPGDSATRPTIASLVICAVVICVIIEAIRVLAVNAGVSFKPEGLAVHKLRTRTLPWTEIASFSVERTWHGTRLVAHEVSGRRTRLSGPRIGFLLWDDDFAIKAWAVDGWWRAATGIAAPPLDLSSVRKPAVWKKVVVGLAVAAFTYELVIGTLVTALLLAFS